MTDLSSTTAVPSGDTRKLGRLLVEHLAEHGAEISLLSDCRWSVRSKGAVATIAAGANDLSLETVAPDAEALMEVKYLLASHLGEFNPESACDIRWRGDGEEIASLPNVRTLAVVGTLDLSPHIRRITFQSENIQRFDTPAALHVKLLFPRQDCPLVLPRLTPHGVVDWGSARERALIRKYTIRRIDASAGKIVIDFVLHKDGGPGSRFAENAQCGDVVGMIGPGGGSASVADWMLFAGDETALPAIARLVETLPATAGGIAMIEVEDSRDEQEILHDSGIEIRWLHRQSRRKSELLAAEVAGIDLSGRSSLFAWAGTEFEAFRTIRAHWRRSARLSKQQHLAVAYWREGHVLD